MYSWPRRVGCHRVAPRGRPDAAPPRGNGGAQGVDSRVRLLYRAAMRSVMIFGVMKTSSSVFLVDSSRFLNSQPM